MRSLAVVLALLASPALAQATFSVRVLTPETALKAAQAALKKCRDSGFQVTVAVVDRMGVTQVLRILATDPGSVKDFQSFCKQTGNELLSQAEANREFTFFMKRK